MRILASLILSLTLGLPSLVAAQSLGSVARKEAERRQKNREKGVDAPTFDSQNLGEDDDGREGDEPKTEASDAPAASPKDEDGDEGAAPDGEPVPTLDLEQERQRRARDEAEWHQRMRQAELRVERAQETYDAVKDLTLVRGQYYVDSEGRTVIGSVEELQEIVRKARAELEEAQAAIEALQDEARRAGVPPGWLR